MYTKQENSKHNIQPMFTSLWHRWLCNVKESMKQNLNFQSFLCFKELRTMKYCQTCLRLNMVRNQVQDKTTV